MKDEIFSKPQHKQFEFDAHIASVFDDMIMRSIPFYRESLELGVHFILQNLTKYQNARLLDLGSSSGNFLITLASHLTSPIKLTGIDSSPAMCEHARHKALAHGYDIKFLCEDILKADFSSNHAISAYYTLQFIRPIMRASLVKKIHTSLEDGGIFILAEKINSSDKTLDKQMIERYYQFKSTQGYTQSEISTKREALENVLIPYTLDENIMLLKDAGFRHIEVIFKWVNFATLLAIK